MKTGNLNEIVNKGIPTSQTILISLRDLINLSRNKNRADQAAYSIWAKHITDLETIIGTPIPFSLFESLCVVIDEKTLEKKIIFSPNCAISGVAVNLNLFNDADKVQIGTITSYTTKNPNKELEDMLEEKIHELRMVSSERKLAKKFPYLYHSFKENNEMALKLFHLKKNTKNELQYRMTLRNMGMDFELAQRFEMYENFENFIRSCLTAIEKILEKHEEIKENIRNNTIDLSNIKIDEEKLNLYITYNNLIMAEEAASIEEKQKYLYYLSYYFNEYGNKGDVSITIGEIKDGMEKHRQKGLIITKKEVHERYNKLLVENPELRIVDFSKEYFNGMTLEQVEAFMSGYLTDLQATWDFLTNTKELDKDVVELIKNNSTTKNILTEEERKAKQDRLLDLYIEKKEVFEKTNPLYRIKGKRTFNGYIGYIYPNGRVILEKFFENAKTGRVSTGNAIYAMDIRELVVLSKMPKKTLMENELCKRIIHNGEWQKKVLEEISNNQENDQKDVIEKILQNCQIK